MKVTEEGTTNIIKWYQPESSEECKSIDCRKCVYYQYANPEYVYNQYVQRGIYCQFKQYLIDRPVEKPTDSDKPSNALQYQRSAQDILNMCATLQANTMQMQVDPLQDMVNVLDLIIEVTEKQDELTEIRHEQSVAKKKQDSVQQVQVKRYQRYRIERVVVKADDTQDSNIAIPDNAIMMKHAIITPGIFNFERDLVHVITWLEPIE